MRSKWIVLLVLVLTMAAAALPAAADYSAAEVYNFFMDQDMGDVRWFVDIHYEEGEPWVTYSATADIGDHEYYFQVHGGDDDGENVVWEMGISGWYPDLEPNGKQGEEGRKVYQAFLETLAHFLPDSHELREIFNPENIYYMLRGGYSFNYQPKDWYTEYSSQYGWVSAVHHNRNYVCANRPTQEDEITPTNFFSFYFSIN